MAITCNNAKTVAVCDTGAWISVVTSVKANSLGIVASSDTVQLSGLGVSRNHLSCSTTIRIGHVVLHTRFVIVEHFPFTFVLGLRDLLALSKNAGVLERIRVVPMPVTCAVPNSFHQDSKSRDVTTGIDESKTDEELLRLGKLQFASTFKFSDDPDSKVFERVWAVLVRHRKAWLRPRCGQYTGPKAHIEVEGPPCKGKLRPLSPNLKLVVEEHLTSQLNAGVIEPSRSPWASPIHIVKKANGEWRIVIDYRDVNKRIKSNRYPLPLIGDIIREAAGYKYYITLDMNWGFWNLPLTTASREITAFITHRGLYQFLVLPFGMCNSPAEFQYMSDSIYGHLYSTGVRVYIDDIVIFSNELDEVIDLLEQVLSATSKGGVYLKLSKCSFLPDTAKVLGHLLSCEGIQIDPTRIQGLRAAGPPSNRKTLRSFLGTCNYLSSFIPDYSEITYPLRKLGKKATIWVWGDEQQSAYETLLQFICDAVTLSPPIGSGPFLIFSDASSHAVGGCLLQQQDHGVVPISFFSKSLNDTEQRWDTREREAYAIKYALERNRDIIRGHRIYVLTDHSSLQWAKDAPQSKVQRWMWYIQQFDVHIVFISGKVNHLGDWMSRSIALDSADADDIIDQVAVPLMTLVAGKERLELPSITQLKSAIATVPADDRVLCFIGAEDGLLYHQRSNKLYIPLQYRDDFIFWIHVSSVGLHRGINSTVRQLTKYVWWPKIHSSVRTFVEACLVCRRNRQPMRSTSSKVLQRPTANELISIDYVGPRLWQGSQWYYVVVIDHCTRFVMTDVTDIQSSDHSVAILRDRWIPVFSAPNVVLADNGATFTSEVFRNFITQDLKSHLVYTSPYYPQGNAINESCHKSIDHGLKCREQSGDASLFRDAVREVTLAYNAAYQSVIRDSPYGTMFGKPPILPGFQSLSSVVPEENRSTELRLRNTIRNLRPHLPAENTLVSASDKTDIQVGDFILYPRSGYEQAAFGSDKVSKYNASWSLPCKVVDISSNQLSVVEYGTGRARKVAKSQVQRLPTEVPSAIQRINWDHIAHQLPRRWKVDLTTLPPVYHQFHHTQAANKDTPDNVAAKMPAISQTTLPKKRRLLKHNS